LETDEIFQIGIDLWELWGLCPKKFVIELQDQITKEFVWLRKRIVHKRLVNKAAKKLYMFRKTYMLRICRNKMQFDIPMIEQ
jgi:hypothetical protein